MSHTVLHTPPAPAPRIGFVGILSWMVLQALFTAQFLSWMTVITGMTVFICSFFAAVVALGIVLLFHTLWVG